MTLWWVKREELDKDQVNLIEKLDIHGSYLVLGPPGSGKTNVLLRRAQFVRSQDLPNVLVLTFTRPLTEFLKTGCLNSSGSEVFPPSLVSTIEAWSRSIYRALGVDIPEDDDDFDKRKAAMASGALAIADRLKQPPYDAIFVDEAQDLLEDEVKLLKMRTNRLFFVGDDKQRIFSKSTGLAAIKTHFPTLSQHSLTFHYRIAPELCTMADRIIHEPGGKSLSETCHYSGPRPGRIDIHCDLRERIIELAVDSLEKQMRVYEDRIVEGDRLGIVVPRKDDRQDLADALEANHNLRNKWQIVKSKSSDAEDRSYCPTLDPSRPILIMTEQACKGLEFRSLHWLFVDNLSHYRTDERYYTIVTRAKTSLDIYHTKHLPTTLARAHSKGTEDLWS